jgi:hypothetical protein
VVIRSHNGDISLVSNKKIRIYGAIELGGVPFTGGDAGLGGGGGLGEGTERLLSALSVINGTVRITAPLILHDGSFVAGNGTIQLGEDRNDTIDVRGTVHGRTAFSFGGAVDDEHRTSLVVDEPTSAFQTIVLPDASGRLVVSAAAPLSVTPKGEVQMNFTLFDSISCAIVSNQSDPNIGKSLAAVVNSGGNNQSSIFSPKGVGVRLTSPPGKDAVAGEQPVAEEAQGSFLQLAAGGAVQDNAQGGTIYINAGAGEGKVGATGGDVQFVGGAGEGEEGASGGDVKFTGGGSASVAGCAVGMYTCGGQLVSAVVYKAGGLLSTSTLSTLNVLLLLLRVFV